MKRYKKIGVVIFLVYALTFIIPTNVYAKVGVECTQVKAEEKYKPNVKDDGNGKYIVSVKDGSFNVKVTGTTELTGTVDASKTLEIPYEQGKTVYIVVTLKTNKADNLCLPGSEGFEDQAKDPTGSAKFVYTLRKDYPDDKIKNTNIGENSQCQEFKDSDEYKNASATIKAEFQRRLSYCWSEEVNVNYSDEVLKKMIDNAKDMVALMNKSTTSKVSNPTFDELWNKVTGGNDNNVLNSSEATESNVKTLKCDPFKKEKLPGEDYYTNEKSYAKKKETQESDSCKKKCREVVTVQYGPPIASKAGLCFEYKVKIKSKVSCETTFTGQEPTMPKTCTPYPICNGVNGFQDQGGPNEDFDKCINKCDGGKYSQKCINKCYKKVYGKTESQSLQLSYESSSQIKKLSTADYTYNASNFESQVNEIYAEKQQNPGGEYVRDTSGKIKWSPKYDNGKITYAGKDLNQLAIYYFSTRELTRRTLLGLAGKTWTGIINGKTITDTYTYIVDDKGFKRSTSCKESCEFKGCEDTSANPNAADAMKKYQDALNDYITDRNNCTAEASCTTKTAEFKMSVKYSVKDGKEETVSFPLESKYDSNKVENSTKINFTEASTNSCGYQKEGESSIIIDQAGICYGCANKYYDYMTEIRFPGSWVNNKTGEVSYTEKSEKFYHKVEDKFCTPLLTKSVNEKWWIHDQVNNTCYTQDEIKEKLKYNIISELRNFGYMDWYFNVECFYALNNTEVDTSDKNTCPTIIDDDDPKNCENNPDKCVGIENYKFRSVKNDNLFPANGKESTSTLTQRTPGFNWSESATNLTNAKYEITPTALTKAIQERKDDIYNNDDKYLDYEFKLTKSTINKIREYNKKVGNYTTYGDNTKTVNGVIVYASNLFRGSGAIIDSDQVTAKGALGCNNQSAKNSNECETFNDDYVNSMR